MLALLSNMFDLGLDAESAELHHRLAEVLKQAFGPADRRVAIALAEQAHQVSRIGISRSKPRSCSRWGGSCSSKAAATRLARRGSAPCPQRCSAWPVPSRREPVFDVGHADDCTERWAGPL